MIVKQKDEIEVKSNSDEKDLDLIIDPEESGKLFSLLLESYKNPISSLIREYTSNAWDAHREVGKTDIPVIVEIDEDEGGKFIKFIDEGIGMSDEFFRNTYRKLLKSTKDKSNESIGGFGIGSKTALAYTYYYYVDTVYNGELNQYVIYRESNKSIKISNINRVKDDNLKSGTTVKVYLKEDSICEEEKFENACIKELCYFDNVILRFKTNPYLAEEYNKSKILETKTFKYREQGRYDSYAHIVLGKVSYPIDYREIDRTGYYCLTPIAVKFEIGELPVNLNRETILYNDESRNLIIKRLDAAIEELTSIYNSKNKPIYNFIQYSKKLTQDTNIKYKYLEIDNFGLIFIDGAAFKKRLNSIQFLPAKLLGFNPSPKEKIIPFLREKCVVKDGRVTKHAVSIKDTFKNTPLVIYKDKNPVNDKKFLNYIKNCSIIKYDPIYAHEDYYRSKFSKLLDTILPKVKKRVIKIDRFGDVNIQEKEVNENSIGLHKRIIAYRKILMNQIKESFDTVIDYDTFEIPDSWRKEQKELAKLNRIKIERAEGTIPCKIYDVQTGIKSSINLNLNQLYKFTGIIIYGFLENSEMLSNICKLLCNNKHFYKESNIRVKAVAVYQIAKSNEKAMQNFKNAIHVNSFFRSPNRVIVRTYTAYKIKKEFKLLLVNHDIIYNLNRRVGTALKNLKEYVSNNLIYKYDDEIQELFKELDVLNEVIPIFDKNVKQDFDFCRDYFKGLSILKSIDLSRIDTEYLVELLKEQNKLLNYEYYHKNAVKSIIKIEEHIPFVEQPFTDLRDYAPIPIKIS